MANRDWYFSPLSLDGRGRGEGDADLAEALAVNVKRARALRRDLTEAERALWGHLRHRQLHEHKFRRQQPIGAFIVDFVCLERMLVIELDGGQHAAQAGRDAERTAWLESQGFHVLRFWNHDVLRDIQAVMEVIRNALLDGPPHPRPLPRRGEGERRERVPRWREGE
jgi:very-short-patch-repair endonuclease